MDQRDRISRLRSRFPLPSHGFPKKAIDRLNWRFEVYFLWGSRLLFFCRYFFCAHHLSCGHLATSELLKFGKPFCSFFSVDSSVSRAEEFRTFCPSFPSWKMFQNYFSGARRHVLLFPWLVINLWSRLIDVGGGIPRERDRERAFYGKVNPRINGWLLSGGKGGWKKGWWFLSPIVRLLSLLGERDSNWGIVFFWGRKECGIFGPTAKCMFIVENMKYR